jgi:hypothetical protein
MGLEICRRLHPLMAMAECGWWWPFKGAVILTERPVFISRDAQARLHCEDRAAIEYPDGWGVYSWRGVRVPQDVIITPGSITTERIEKESNAEVRRVMITRYGFDRYLKDSGAKRIHKDKYGELYRKEIKGGDPLVGVKVQNSTPEPDGSIKSYWLKVHHELRPLLANGQLGEPQDMTAVNAIASTFGMRGEDYKPERET